MFGWFKKKTAPDPADERFARMQAHYAAAEGTHLVRCCVAAVLTEIQDDLVQKQLPGLPADKRDVYVMTYACYLTWALKRGMEMAPMGEQIGPVIVAVQARLAKEPWFQPCVNERIWDKMQMTMPHALETTSEGFPPYPVAEMLIAADIAGFALSRVIDPDVTIGMQISAKLPQLIGAGQVAGRKQLELGRR